MYQKTNSERNNENQMEPKREKNKWIERKRYSIVRIFEENGDEFSKSLVCLS